MEMPWEHPTAGDYARNANQNLEKRVKHLEERVQTLADMLVRLARTLSERSGGAA